MHQAEEGRYVLHLLYANTINRGGPMNLSGGTISRSPQSVEVIEDLTPLHGTTVSLQLPNAVKRVTLEPQGVELPFTTAGEVLTVSVDEFACHQMVVLEYAG